MTRRVIRVAVIAVVVVAAFFGIAYLRSRTPAAVDTSDGGPAVTFTGSYADDWQSNCGPLGRAAQAACAVRLDARYGKVAGAPVPPAQPKRP